ncbi:Uncharacterised protein [Cedecea neteri]|uniref:Uncharacterized protein n=1 Tax=Cedecea neteri TaxID=158822 RepID=A0A2X2T1Z2_9ENTR|nr:Uncharacterised protein [Cedecea neteri]
MMLARVPPTIMYVNRPKATVLTRKENPRPAVLTQEVHHQHGWNKEIEETLKRDADTSLEKIWL